MRTEFEPIVEHIDEQFGRIEGLLLEKRELGFEDDDFIQTNIFEARVNVRFPSPDELVHGIISGDSNPAPTDSVPDLGAEVFDTTQSDRDLALQLRTIIASAKDHAAKLGAAASWMVKAFGQAEIINQYLGDFGLYYECVEDYLRGVGARFCSFESIDEAQKTASDIVLVSGSHKGKEYEGRLLHVQPLLNIAWILPNNAPWSIKQAVPLDMELDQDDALKVHIDKPAINSQLWRQPGLF